MGQKLYITDLVSSATLQRIQDAFSAMTGMAALTTDNEGVPVTKGSNFTDYCMKYIRCSKTGHALCEKCDKYGAVSAWKKKGPTYYRCHSGLIDYAAPILANGEMVGSFIGGQVLTEELQKEKVYQTAEGLELPPDELWEAAQRVRILNQTDIDAAAQFLYTVASVLSDMAYGKYMALQANVEIEKANSMKSDFLANMSHEIRTPMNAVLGMAEMALREDLPPAARSYIHQIKASSKTLLTIINDILDFSKIESGKMDIVPDEYEPMSIIYDVSNIAMERLKDKKVELVLDISPDIPSKLYGDNIRIKQILLNLVNNAAKFTNSGQVLIRMKHREYEKDKIILRFDVEDTGIGIKEEDMKTIFNSFQQLDSKRNRNIEGTGLGLPISRQLAELMGGHIEIQSVYNKGSIFSLELPQVVVSEEPSSSLKNTTGIKAIGLLENEFVKEQFAKDMDYFGVEYQEICSIKEAVFSKEKENFLFVEKEKFMPEIEEYVKENPQITAVLLLPFKELDECDIPNLLLIKKPLYTLNEAMIFNREGLHFVSDDAATVNIDFIAPTAEVLVVDDNAINLTVAEGLLEPLKMKVDTATSGKEAIGKISVCHYDLILMDHMMPELDGVETTHIIRRLHPEYNDVPIIALTANAISGSKEMFISEGMNDFVAKPIELKTLVAKIAQWLPVEKVQRTKGVAINAAAEAESEEDVVVGDLNTKAAIKLLGSKKLFWKVLKDYYRVIDKKSKLIKELEEKGDWAAYTIEVHALKSSSKQIGAMELSEKAAEMEKAGNARNSDLIRSCTDDMLIMYRNLIPVLAPFCMEKEEKEKSSEKITDKQLLGFFEDMRSAMEELDMDQMEAVIESMAKYSYQGKEQELFEQLGEAVDNINVDVCEDIIKEWSDMLIQNN